MQMSDDVEARLTAVRVLYQQGHIPCRSTRFTSSCARKTNQSAVRMSLKSVCWEESVTKGYHRELLFLLANNPLRETISVSLARFTSRCKVSLPVTFCEFPQAQDTGHHQHIVWHVSQVARALPRNLQVRFARNKRLPCVVRARSAWRCATPCGLPALPLQRGMPLP